MAETSGFFNSSVGDIREYGAPEFAEYFSNFLSNGIFTKDNKLGLRVTAGTGLRVNVDIGNAYIRGYKYKNDSILFKTIAPSDPILSRIDRIVLRFDEVSKEIKVAVKTGVFGSTPTPPTLEDTATTKELSLAQVIVNKGATTVSIIDERLTDLCGQVNLLIKIPLDDLLLDWIAWKDSNQLEFEAWLAMLDDMLDANVAANLASRILALENDLNLHRADDTIIKHRAKQIALEDVANKFTATNVEGAMTELFTNVSDGKQAVGTAITDVDNSIVIPTNPTHADLASAIGQISRGKKSESGTGTTTAGGHCIVTGLKFKPKTIIITGNVGRYVYDSTFSNGYFYDISTGGVYPMSLTLDSFDLNMTSVDGFSKAFNYTTIE